MSSRSGSYGRTFETNSNEIDALAKDSMDRIPGHNQSTKEEHMKTLLIIAALIAGANISCAVCTAQATRCSGQLVEICDSRGHWRPMMNCDSVYGGHVFTCQETIDLGVPSHTCLPDGL